jgi:DNA-binding phage protein
VRVSCKCDHVVHVHFSPSKITFSLHYKQQQAKSLGSLTPLCGYMKAMNTSQALKSVQVDSSRTLRSRLARKMRQHCNRHHQNSRLINTLINTLLKVAHALCSTASDTSIGTFTRFRSLSRDSNSTLATLSAISLAISDIANSIVLWRLCDVPTLES